VSGFIGLESDDPQHEWSEDELAIVEATAAQAAQSVENARLLADSQRRATREKISAEVGARLQASLEPQIVLHNAVQEIALQLGIAEVSVELLPETPQPGDHGEEAAGAYLPPTVISGEGDATSSAVNHNEVDHNDGENTAAITAGHPEGDAHEPA
jgi:GAF domain-containing protein